MMCRPTGHKPDNEQRAGAPPGLQGTGPACRGYSSLTPHPPVQLPPPPAPRLPCLTHCPMPPLLRQLQQDHAAALVHFGFQALHAASQVCCAAACCPCGAPAVGHRLAASLMPCTRCRCSSRGIRSSARCRSVCPRALAPVAPCCCATPVAAQLCCLQLRIGIHSGPVMSGVLGTMRKKYSCM
jgi:hypothetical protein